ncbi:MAG: efflux RND transporter permease subunit [Verrucomicrobiales bacterium]|nr:efflux RND transporter permease subunit [Verrucomicrobiales bacterium]
MREFAVNRPVSVLMLTLLMIFFGAAAYQRLPQDLFPDVSQPTLVIETVYTGAASSEIEQNVTRKIEEKLGTVKGTTSLASASGDERSRITLTFQWGTNMDLAAMDVRAKLDEVRSLLPEEAEEPVVLRGSSATGAVMVLNVASNPAAPNPVHPDELRNVVMQTIKPGMERLNGVALVEVKGGKEYEVQVRVVPDKIRAAGLSILDVRDALERENISQRGGKLREGDSQFLIRTVGTVAIENLSRLIVSRPGEPVRRLGEVADVTPREVEKAASGYARLKTGKSTGAIPSVEVSIYKKSGGNSVAICASAREVMSEVLFVLATDSENGSAEPLSPLQITIAYDESVFIKESLDMVRTNGVTGLVLASIILLVFLGRFQSTFIVVLAMPVSVIATFSLFYAVNISINIFSMAGLTLAVGMVVDNAIVMTEAIFQKMSYERRIRKAVVEAISEIGPAIRASTLTTIAVFLPVVFVPGIAGQIFRDLSWVITYTLIFSMVVAFTLIPMLTFKVMDSKMGVFDGVNRIIGFLLQPLMLFGKGVSKLYKVVLSIVIESVAVRLLLILVMALAFTISVNMWPSAEFFPETKVESYRLVIRPRAGQTLESVDRASRLLEKKFTGVANLKDYNISVSPREVGVIASFDKDEVKAGKVYPVKELRPVLDALNADPELGDAFLDHRLESLNPIQSLLGTNTGDILLKVSGRDLNVIREILAGTDGDGGLLGALMEQRDAFGIAGISRIPKGVPERILKVKRDAAADRGLTLVDIADQVEVALSGKKATDIEIRNTTFDIILSSSAKVSSEADILNLDIVSPSTGLIWKLGDVASLEAQLGAQQIDRIDRERVIMVPIFIDKESIPLAEVVKKLGQPGGIVEQAIAPYRDAGYRVSIGGASEAMNESLKYLLYAFIVAVVLVYMIMASQFESLIHPFTIMFAVPLSLIGAVIGLNLSGELVSLTAMIGIIMLAGIVVNNAIILIDYINILRARGQSRNEAIINAGLTRLRPILMTTFTTVLGMFPLALGYGTGAELYRPLAVVVVCGLSFSTLLTLVFIPAIYCFLDDVTDLLGFISFRITTLYTRRSTGTG